MQIHEVRAEHVGLDQRITVSGCVSKVSTQRPSYTDIAYICLECGAMTRWPQELDGPRTEPPDCDNLECRSSGPFRIEEDESEKIDLQDIVIIQDFHSKHAKYDTFRRELNVVLMGSTIGLATEGGCYDFTGELKIQSSTRKKSEYVLYADEIVTLPEPIEATGNLTDVTLREKSKMRIIRDVIKELSAKTPGNAASLEEIYREAESSYGITEVQAEEVIKKMYQQGDLISPDRGHFKLV